MARISDKTVGFVGGGNMAEAIVQGLLAGPLAGERITVAEPVAARRRLLARRYGVATTAENDDAATCDVLVLAVKPQIMDDVLAGLSGSIAPRTVVVSIAAGAGDEKLGDAGERETSHADLVVLDPGLAGDDLDDVVAVEELEGLEVVVSAAAAARAAHVYAN